LDEASRSPGKFVQTGGQEPDSPVSSYRFVGGTEEHWFLFAERGKPWQDGPIASDAEFVCWSRWNQTGTQQLIVVNGSMAEVKDGPRLRFQRTVSWGELSQKGDQREIFSSEPDAVENEPAFSVEGGSDAGSLS
jgi:hypothetical protein